MAIAIGKRVLLLIWKAFEHTGIRAKLKSGDLGIGRLLSA